MTEPMTSKRLSEIRDLHADAQEGLECCWRHVVEAVGELLAEVDRLQAQVADAWDGGWDAAAEAEDKASRIPRGTRVTLKAHPNPHRAALASSDEVQP